MASEARSRAVTWTQSREHGHVDAVTETLSVASCGETETLMDITESEWCVLIVNIIFYDV